MRLAAASVPARRLARRARAAVHNRRTHVPAAGFDDLRVDAPLVERLTDAELARLNELLPWSCFVADGKGRRFGDAAWSGKREAPQAVPDRRIQLMEDRLGLTGKHVLEIGCFEGVHTTGLARFAGAVTAVDSRIDNVVKTIVRCAFLACHPDVFTCDVDTAAGMAELATVGADLVHHVGVLYHLREPVQHLLALGAVARRGVMLDTHISSDADATEAMTVDGHEYKYRHYLEGGAGEVFSGMYDHAKWLTLEGLTDALHRAGFVNVDVVERREERNGPRVLLFATR